MKFRIASLEETTSLANAFSHVAKVGYYSPEILQTEENKRVLNISIDGFPGIGKSTFSKAFAYNVFDESFMEDSFTYTGNLVGGRAVSIWQDWTSSAQNWQVQSRDERALQNRDIYDYCLQEDRDVPPRQYDGINIYEHGGFAQNCNFDMRVFFDYLQGYDANRLVEMRVSEKFVGTEGYKQFLSLSDPMLVR